MNSFENDCLYCFSAQKWIVNRSQFMLFKMFNLHSKQSKKLKVFFKYQYFLKLYKYFILLNFFSFKNFLNSIMYDRSAMMCDRSIF